MAYIFELGINFGDKFVKAQEQAKLIEKRFEGACTSYSVEDGECWISVYKYSYGQGGPLYEFRSGGPASKEEAEEMTQFGKLLYNDILPTVEGYHFAWVGVEVTGFRTVKEVIELIDDPEDNRNFPGLVISSEMKKLLTCTVFLQQYAPGYWWAPYEGENYDR